MLKRILPKTEFSKNVLTLISGTTMAQMLPFLLAPLLARLYTKADFGVLTIFTSVTAILSIVGAGRYELAIIQAKKDEEAINIFALGLLILTAFSLLLMGVVLVFNAPLAAMLGDEHISFWLYFVPVAVFLLAFVNLLTNYNNRKKYYKNTATATVARSGVLSVTQVAVGYVKTGAMGLISGQLLAALVANAVMFTSVLKDRVLWSKVSQPKMIALGKAYKRFPQYDLWSALFNVAASNVMVLLMADLFSVAVVGLYGFAFKIISRPSTLIGTAFGQVFYQSSADVREDKQAFRAIVWSTYKKLVMMSVLPFSILAFYSDYIFSFVFSAAWLQSGVYTQILSPWLMIAFIASPLSTVLLSLNKQNVLLRINIVLFVFRVSSILLGSFIFDDIIASLVMLSVSGVLVYTFLIIYIFRLVGQNLWHVVRYSLVYFLLVILVGLSRYAIQFLVL